MKIVFYGGSFDPPHSGHVLAARAAYDALRPDRLLIVPDYEAPHKRMASGGASPEHRMELCRLAFSSVPGAEVSGLEINRGGKSYTSDSLREILSENPGAEVTLLMGTDMFLSFERWYDAQWMLRNAALAVLPRTLESRGAVESHAAELREKYGTCVTVLDGRIMPISSTVVRSDLCERAGTETLPAEEYAYIIRHRLYGARPSAAWLRERAKELLKPKRVAHVLGCEQEAMRLALRYGADVSDAAEAALLHDITKKCELAEQLILCEKYGIIADKLESTSTKLLHARTGAALARDCFGVSDAVRDAIRWHTTGKADMTLLEKIIYMADYIEPTRDFPGVERLRELAYDNLDEALVLGLKMSLEDIISRSETPHENTMRALQWYESACSKKENS